MFGICHLSIVPCRKEPSDKSEMVSQLLFGEYFEVIEQEGNWCHIRNAYDNYESWIDKKQFQTLTNKEAQRLKSNKKNTYSGELIQLISTEEDGNSFPLVIGSILPFYKDNYCLLGTNKFLYEGQVISPGSKPTQKAVIETAFLFLNAPYLWGGRSPFGIDCSGFTQLVYKLNGIKLLRDASQQVQQGKALSFVDEARPGDLAFFDNKDGNIIHVGIVLEDSQIIHASGKVRIDLLDHNGIFNKETGTYSHQLRILKRVL